MIESDWEVCSAGTVEYRGSEAEEDTPRKPGTEHRQGATIGRRKGTQTPAGLRRPRRPLSNAEAVLMIRTGAHHARPDVICTGESRGLRIAFDTFVTVVAWHN